MPLSNPQPSVDQSNVAISGGTISGATIPDLNLFTVNTIADLRTATIPVTIKKLDVLGYYAINDGGGGIFYLDASDTTTSDDSGSVIVNGTRRWKRIVKSDDYINVLWFGAKLGTTVTSDVTANTTALNKALVYHHSTGSGTDINGIGVLIPTERSYFCSNNPTLPTTTSDTKRLKIYIQGQWRLTQTLVISRADVELIGLGLDSFQFTHNTSTSRIIPTFTTSDSNPLIAFTAYVYKHNFENLTFEGFVKAPEFSCTLTKFTNCGFQSGLSVIGNFWVWFKDCEFRENVLLDDNTTNPYLYIGLIYFDDCIFYDAPITIKANGVSSTGVFDVNFRNCLFEVYDTNYFTLDTTTNGRIYSIGVYNCKIDDQATQGLAWFHCIGTGTIARIKYDCHWSLVPEMLSSTSTCFPRTIEVNGYSEGLTYVPPVTNVVGSLYERADLDGTGSTLFNLQTVGTFALSYSGGAVTSTTAPSPDGGSRAYEFSLTESVYPDITPSLNLNTINQWDVLIIGGWEKSVSVETQNQGAALWNLTSGVQSTYFFTQLSNNYKIGDWNFKLYFYDCASVFSTGITAIKYPYLYFSNNLKVHRVWNPFLVRLPATTIIGDIVSGKIVASAGTFANASVGDTLRSAAYPNQRFTITGIPNSTSTQDYTTVNIAPVVANATGVTFSLIQTQLASRIIKVAPSLFAGSPQGALASPGDIYTPTIVNAGQFKLNTLNTAPASASATGTVGEIRIDANYVYICTATNTWKRSAISTW